MWIKNAAERGAEKVLAVKIMTRQDTTASRGIATYAKQGKCVVTARTTETAKRQRKI